MISFILHIQRSHPAATAKGSSSHDSIVVSDDSERKSMKKKPSSLSTGRALSSPAISVTDGSTSGAAKTVVSAVVHPQTPSAHSRANKVQTTVAFAY